MAGKTRREGDTFHVRSQLYKILTGKKARKHTWEWPVLFLGGLNFACILFCIDNISYHVIKFLNGSVTSDSKSWLWWPQPCLHSPPYFHPYIFIPVALTLLICHVARHTVFQDTWTTMLAYSSWTWSFCEFKMITSKKGSALTEAPSHLENNLFIAYMERKPCVIHIVSRVIN